MYGIDVESGILRDRSARWLQARIGGLIASGETRISRYLQAPNES